MLSGNGLGFFPLEPVTCGYELVVCMVVYSQPLTLEIFWRWGLNGLVMLVLKDSESSH
jgi:hypothetical protein